MRDTFTILDTHGDPTEVSWSDDEREIYTMQRAHGRMTSMAYTPKQAKRLRKVLKRAIRKAEGR